MQLKRDTDYALRILLCIAKQEDIDKNGMTISELSKGTSVPQTIAIRLCEKMKDAKLLNAAGTNENITLYSLHKGAINKTVFDVIRAIEGGINLFAVFDRSTELYASGKDYFEDTEQKLADSLKQKTIRGLNEKRKKFEKKSK